MFCKIELLPKQAIAKEDAEELIWTFLCSLERNGQILKDYKLAKGKNYTMYVTLPKPDSFDEKYDGVYVRQERKKVKEIYSFIVTLLGENIESQQYCDCKKRTAIEIAFC